MKNMTITPKHKISILSKLYGSYMTGSVNKMLCYQSGDYIVPYHGSSHYCHPEDLWRFIRWINFTMVSLLAFTFYVWVKQKLKGRPTFPHLVLCVWCWTVLRMNMDASGSNEIGESMMGFMSEILLSHYRVYISSSLPRLMYSTNFR